MQGAQNRSRNLEKEEKVGGMESQAEPHDWYKDN